MNIIHKIAKPCAIVGAVWGLLAPILVLLPITRRGVTPPVTMAPGHEVLVLRRPVLGWGKEMVSMVEAGVAADVVPILSFIALMGLLGFLAIVLSKQRPHLGRIFLWVSTSAMFVVSLVSIFSIGLFFIPASILLMLAAIGLRKGGIPAEEAVLRGEQP